MRIAVPAVAGLFIVTAILLAGGGAWPDATPADASFHLMRVHAVMRAANGDTRIQYVELRMASGGQTQISGYDLCFFDPSGDPWARFTFPDNVLGNAAAGSSILVGSRRFASDGRGLAAHAGLRVRAGEHRRVRSIGGPLEPGV